MSTQQKLYSKKAYILSVAVMFIASWVYYPKWTKNYSEATISWDASGYYWYLPAFLIYQDAKQQTFQDSVLKKYIPTPELLQAYSHPSGNFVMKYSSGMALQYLPWFAVAHVLAEPLGYPADGFSLPYQFCIQLGGFLWALFGLWMLRKVLLRFYSDEAVALTMLLYVLGTNYLNNTVIDSAMTHNWLFTWYTLLLYATIRFYEKPTRLLAVAIGGCVGIMALTRPTEIIAMILPLGWGISSLRPAVLLERIRFVVHHLGLYVLAAVVTGCIGFIQPLYWHYATGEWFVYSYQDQGFNWVKPHIADYLFSYRSGLFVYHPLVLIGFIGLVPFFRRKQNTLPVIAFILLNTYLVCAWEVWWYGTRAMVQSYAVLALPFAAVMEAVLRRRKLLYALLPVFLIGIYYNMWWTHNIHRGSLMDALEMRKAYFWRVVGRISAPPETKRLLDSKYWYEGIKRDRKVLVQENFESDSLLLKAPMPDISGQGTEYVNRDKQFSRAIPVSITPGEYEWVRASATFLALGTEWDTWRMAQFCIRFRNGDQEVCNSMLRVFRFTEENQRKRLFVDCKVPKEPFDKVEVYLWGADGGVSLLMDDLTVEAFNAE